MIVIENIPGTSQGYDEIVRRASLSSITIKK